MIKTSLLSIVISIFFQTLAIAENADFSSSKISTVNHSADLINTLLGKALVMGLPQSSCLDFKHAELSGDTEVEYYQSYIQRYTQREYDLMQAVSRTLPLGMNNSKIIATLIGRNLDDRQSFNTYHHAKIKASTALISSNRLNDWGREALSQNRFDSVCGNRFISGIKREQHAFLSASLNFIDAQDYQSMDYQKKKRLGFLSDNKRWSDILPKEVMHQAVIAVKFAGVGIDMALVHREMQPFGFCLKEGECGNPLIFYCNKTKQAIGLPQQGNVFSACEDASIRLSELIVHDEHSNSVDIYTDISAEAVDVIRSPYEKAVVNQPSQYVSLQQKKLLLELQKAYLRSLRLSEETSIGYYAVNGHNDGSLLKKQRCESRHIETEIVDVMTRCLIPGNEIDCIDRYKQLQQYVVPVCS